MIWKEIVIPIIIAIIGLLGAGGIVDYFLNTFIYPNIALEILVDENNRNKWKVEVANIGNAPAKELIISVYSPTPIQNYSVLNTENYTNELVDDNTIKLYSKRLVQGPGSLFNINLLSKNDSKLLNSTYTAYVTHAKGSSMASATVYVTEKDDKVISIGDKISSSWDRIGGFTILFYSILAGMIPYLYKKMKENFKKK